MKSLSLKGGQSAGDGTTGAAFTIPVEGRVYAVEVSGFAWCSDLVVYGTAMSVCVLRLTLPVRPVLEAVSSTGTACDRHGDNDIIVHVAHCIVFSSTYSPLSQGA